MIGDHLMLADTTPMISCLELLEDLKASPLSSEKYFMQCGGLRGLNFLLVMEPKKICFFHDQKLFLDYIRLILELIRISASPEEFISRIFSRPVPSGTLNASSQWAWLDTPADTAILERTRKELSEEGKRRFEMYFSPYRSGLILFRNAACRRLLPCWTINEKIPFSTTSSLAENAYRELEPNTNVFFYGHGWLENSQAFQTVKQRIFCAQLAFYGKGFPELQDGEMIYLNSPPSKKQMKQLEKKVVLSSSGTCLNLPS